VTAQEKDVSEYRSVDGLSLLHPSDTPERLPAPVYALDGRLYPLLTLQFTREPVCHWDGYREGTTVLEHEVNLLR